MSYFLNVGWQFIKIICLFVCFNFARRYRCTAKNESLIPAAVRAGQFLRTLHGHTKASRLLYLLFHMKEYLNMTELTKARAWSCLVGYAFDWLVQSIAEECFCPRTPD